MVHVVPYPQLPSKFRRYNSKSYLDNVCRNNVWLHWACMGVVLGMARGEISPATIARFVI